MSEDSIIEKLVSLIQGVSPSNLSFTISTFYSLKTSLNDEILFRSMSELDLPSPPTTNTSQLSTPKFLTSTLPFIFYYFNQNMIDILKPLLDTLIEFLLNNVLIRPYDKLYSKIIFFYSLITSNPSITLLKFYQIAVDFHFQELQATTVNSLLNFYLHQQNYELAISFLKNSLFPSEVANSLLARYHFFVGHLKAITFEYQEGQYHLDLSLRRTPQNQFSFGFRNLVNKHLIIVKMLQGQVPPRNQLAENPIYLKLGHSILQGNLKIFDEVSENEDFKKDFLEILVKRLRSSVLLAGLTMLSHCYSRISFKDIADFLQLSSVEDAETICAKASADEIINCTLDHQNQHLISEGSRSERDLNFSERISKNIQDCFGTREDVQRTIHQQKPSE